MVCNSVWGGGGGYNVLRHECASGFPLYMITLGNNEGSV